MKKLDVLEFSFTKSFIFFKRSKALPKKKLLLLLKKITQESGSTLIFRPAIRHGVLLSAKTGEMGNVSLLVGQSKRSPSFSNGALHENLISYFLLFESCDYCAIQLRHISVADIESFYAYYTKLSYAQVTSVLDDAAKVLKITARIINPAQQGVTGRGYEGTDLNGEMPSYGNGRSIPRNLKAKNGTEIVSITSGAARITTYGQSVGIPEIASWFATYCDVLSMGLRSKFIQRFASPVVFSDEIGKITPTLIVFDSLSFRHLINEEELVIKRCYKRKKAKATPEMVENILATLENSRRIKVYKFNSGHLKLLSNSIQVNLPSLENYVINDGKNDIKISTYINRKDLYSIYFNSPEHIYLSGTIFRDKSAISEIDSVISCLEEITDLSGADREKLLLSKKDTTDTSNWDFFPVSSVFGIVESHISSDDYIFCDDLGDEWADHISFNSKTKTLAFHHSKYSNDEGTGASKLHDIVAQALKNMGHVICSPIAMENKIDGYNIPYPNSKISRIRKRPAGEIDDVATKIAIGRIMRSNDLNRTVAIYCSFLSKKKLNDGLLKLKNGDRVKPHFNQVLWLLSFFISASKEINVRPVIYCQP